MNSFNHQCIPKEFSSQQIRAVKLFISYRYKIQQFLNKFQYQDELNHEANAKRLCQSMYNIIDLKLDLKEKFIKSFEQFIACEENVPIQVNFRKLKYDQLSSLIDQWQISLKQPSLIRPSERLYSIQHRNILFNRIFVEQRQNIQMYFQTISQKKMLKGVDVYQLLVDILSHYFLYQYAADNETFFQKVNSFNNFLQVVESFIHSERRIIVDNKSKDFQYIKLYEFEALVYFWESINPELQLRSDKRFSNCNKQIQTERHEIILTTQIQTQTQKQKEKQLSLEQVINLSLKLFNKLTEKQEDPQNLEMIQNLCESLRKQKIKLLQTLKYKVHTQKLSIQKKNQSSPRFHLSIHNSQEQRQDRQIIYQSEKQFQLQKTQRKSMGSSINIEDLKINNCKKLQDQFRGRYKNFQTTANQIYENKQSQRRSIKKKSPQKPVYQNDPESIAQVSSHKYRFINSHYNNLQVLSEQKISSKLKSVPNGFFNKNNSDNSEQYMLQRNQTQNSSITPSILKLLQKTFQHYSLKTTPYIEIQKLNQFFIDIGIIQQNQTHLTFQLIKKKIIKNVNKIGFVQFLEIMDFIMKSDPDLTYQVIAQFVDLYIKPFKGLSSQKPTLQQSYDHLYQNKNLVQPLFMKNHKDIKNIKYENTSDWRYKYNHQNILSKFPIQQEYERSFLQKQTSEKKSLRYPQKVENIQRKQIYEQFPKSYSNVRKEKEGIQQQNSIRKRFKYYQQTPKFKNSKELNNFYKANDRYSLEKKVAVPILNLEKATKSKYFKG